MLIVILERNEMRKLKRGIAILFTFGVLFCLGGFNCYAAELENVEQNNNGETITVEATVILSGPKPITLPAGDGDSHVVGLGQRTGKAVFSDGRKAEYSNVYFLDLDPGKTVSVWGYTKMLFKDGSWIFIKWESQITGLDPAGEPLFEGVGNILEGTGQYHGIQGTVKYNNWRIPPDNDFPMGARKSKAVFTYTLP
jgi:hypothetical protein